MYKYRSCVVLSPFMSSVFGIFLFSLSFLVKEVTSSSVIVAVTISPSLSAITVLYNISVSLLPALAVVVRVHTLTNVLFIASP